MRLMQRHRAWDRHLQRLVRVLVLRVEADSIANGPQGMCLALGAMPVPALLLKHSYHPFHHPVLLAESGVMNSCFSLGCILGGCDREG